MNSKNYTERSSKFNREWKRTLKGERKRKLRLLDAELLQYHHAQNMAKTQMRREKNLTLFVT